MKRIWIPALLASFLFVNRSYASFETGVITGGGGNTIELEFVSIAQLFLTDLRLDKKQNFEFADFDQVGFENAIEKTQVTGLEKICETVIDPANGAAEEHCLDGQYFPDKNLIRFNVDTWNKKTCLDKVGIVVHEYGRAAGIENGNYKYSSRVHQFDGLVGDCTEYDQEKKFEKDHSNN